MKKSYFIFALLFGAFTAQSCENDGLRQSGNPKVEQTFQSKYPDVTRVEWEKEGKYWVVDFYKNSMEHEAWFDQEGVWWLTEIDLPYKSLPEAVKTAFAASEYHSWRIDDIDMIELKDKKTLYVLEIEKSEQEFDLQYLADGTLLKVVPDDLDDGGNEKYLLP